MTSMHTWANRAEAAVLTLLVATLPVAGLAFIANSL